MRYLIRPISKFVLALGLLAPGTSYGQFGQVPTGGFGTTTGGLGGFPTTGAGTGGFGQTGAGLGTGGSQGLINQSSTFGGFTQNFGSGNTPFSGGPSSLSGASANGISSNGIGTLGGGNTSAGRTGVGTTGSLGGGGFGGTGLGGTGGLGGGLGGLGGLGGGGLGGLGGFGGGLGGLGGRGGIGGLGGFGGGLGGQGGLGQSFGRGGSQNQRGGANSTIRTTMKPAFDMPTPTTGANAVRSQQIQARMARLPLPTKYQGVQVSVVGRKAILTGVVDSEADVRFVTRLVGLESGIDSVESQLAVRNGGQENVPALSNP